MVRESQVRQELSVGGVNVQRSLPPSIPRLLKKNMIFEHLSHLFLQVNSSNCGMHDRHFYSNAEHMTEQYKMYRI